MPRDSESMSEPKDSPVDEQLPRPVPEEGVKAWLCVLGGFFCQFCSFGFLNACGVFQLYYKEEILSNYNDSTISWIITIQIFLMFSLGLIVGVMVDVLGPRKLLLPSTVLALLGIFMLSLSTKFYQVMLTQGIVYGLGAAGLFLPPMVCVGQWFTAHRGLATGIVTSGSSVGGVIFPIMVHRLIRQVGFPSALRWIGLLMACCLVIANLCVTAPFPPKGREKKKSAGVAAFKDLAFVLFTAGCFFMLWGLFGPFNYLPSMAVTRGMSADMGIYLISITNGASVFGRILPGLVADKVGHLNVMVFIAYLSGLSILVYWLPVAYNYVGGALIGFAVVYGLASGGFVSLMTPCVVALCDGKVDELGPKLGAFMFIIAIAALTGLPILGAISDNSSIGFKGLVAFAGAVMTFGGVLVMFARIKKGGLRMVKV
ncbi:MFS general substrate transporter [Aspergillus avenaceus]|uniref:MFS general substrate transporter n=1 Tax=Aspergillus avenaceus TaxID=36643 RepID=A0A5N6U531_ASPAV|nr:MFS general substrate transporter [Aspergillus avenaceus]